MTQQFSVTEVRNALRCPRVFALGRLQGQQVMFPLGASSLGASFHRIVEAFSRMAGDPPRAFRELSGSAQAPEVSAILSRWLIDLLVEELDVNPSYASMPAEVDDLAEALREFARYLAVESRREGVSPAEALRVFLDGAELAVETTLEIGTVVVGLSGRIDAIHAHPRGQLQVVEYKLTDDSNEEIDRAQVALYRALLMRTDRGEAQPVILRFNPGLTRTELSPSTADSLVSSKLLPVIGSMLDWVSDPSSAPATRRRDLCPACPVRGPCSETYRDHLSVRDDPPSSARRPRPEPTGDVKREVPEQPATPGSISVEDPEGLAEANRVRSLILAVLQRRGAKASAKPPMVGARLLQIEVNAVRGRISAIDRAAEDVQHNLRSEHNLSAEYMKDGGLRVFSVARATPRLVRLTPLLERARDVLSSRTGRFVLGEQPDGSVLVGDLSEPTSCHLLIGGTTGSGKSVLLRSIAASLAHYHAPSAIRFTLVDPKRVTFSKLVTGLAAHLAAPLCVDAEAALPLLEDLVADMEDRYKLFEAERVQDIDELNESRPEQDRLARHVVLVDEFQDLLFSKEMKAEFVACIQRLGAKARAAGIHLILATQRPTKDNVPTSIKANLPGQIALKTSAVIESRVILDQPGAEKLLGQGDLLAKLGRGLVRAQAPLD